MRVVLAQVQHLVLALRRAACPAAVLVQAALAAKLGQQALIAALLVNLPTARVAVVLEIMLAVVVVVVVVARAIAPLLAAQHAQGERL
jgi:hypothetical protein